jgi:hypothetical protein
MSTVVISTHIVIVHLHLSFQAFNITTTRTNATKGSFHRVDRVPGFLSGRPNWLPPPPHPQASVAPPPFGSGGEGGGGAISDEGTDTLVLYTVKSKLAIFRPKPGCH